MDDQSKYNLEPLRYQRGSLTVIDQLKLPLIIEWIDVKTAEDAWLVIRKMQVRGAPLIAIVAALGLSVELYNKRSDFTSVSQASTFLKSKIEYLRTSRPTAVNLFNATDQLLALVNTIENNLEDTVDNLITKFIEFSEKMLEDDVKANRSIGRHGAEKILEIVQREKIRVLTICNTGSLATAGYGTALGVIRSLHELGKLEHVYACETRPYNQGSRLTAFEIVEDALPGTLIADSMVSALMSVKGVDCVIVGADRVAANGDTANKIGTFQLAVAAQYHGVPFFTALPSTTIDLTLSDGSSIPIEERPASELTFIAGHQIAPAGIKVWNPGFDLTPCSLIRGVITEVGVAECSDPTNGGIIDMAELLRSKGLEDRCVGAVTPIATGFLRLNERNLGQYLAAHPRLLSLLDIDSSPEALGSLRIREIGDGNLNFVYVAESPAGRSLILKQALPFVRCVGESWPLSNERATFETNALKEEHKHCPQHVPEVYLFDKKNAIIVMQFIAPPHQILRKSLMQGLRLSTIAADLGLFLARTLFQTSGLALSGTQFRLKISEWSRNTPMTSLTEKVIFLDPYMNSSYNRWSTPQLDQQALGIRQDLPLKIAITRLKARFLGSTEALIHGDFHSGSVMACEGSTFVFDPEFAFYGPMGFDTGAILANLLLSYFSQAATNGPDYAEWILSQIVVLYQRFEELFIAQWDERHAKESTLPPEGQAELFSTALFPDLPSFKEAQRQYLRALWLDSIGFAGAKMLRRVVGIAHVADLEAITDQNLRSACEKRALCLSRELILQSQAQSSLTINTPEALVHSAKRLFTHEFSESTWPLPFSFTS